MGLGSDLALGIGLNVAGETGNQIFGEMNQKRALRGQKKALEQQNAASLDLWNKTNYEAQMKHLKKAGLNPGLIYGMGGAGGGTTGNASGNIDNSTGGLNSMAMLQSAMINAQKENIQADTELKKAQAEKTAGVDTESARAGISKTQVDTDLAKLDREFKSATQFQRIEGYVADMRKKEEELVISQNQRQISDNTLNTQIDLLKAQYATELIKQEAMRMGIQVDEQRIKNMVADIAFEARRVKIAEDGQLTNEGRLKLDEYTRDLPDSWKEGIRFVGDVVGKVFSPKIGVGKGKQKWTETAEGKRFKEYWDTWK